MAHRSLRCASAPYAAESTFDHGKALIPSAHFLTVTVAEAVALLPDPSVAEYVTV